MLDQPTPKKRPRIATERFDAMPAEEAAAIQAARAADSLPNQLRSIKAEAGRRIEQLHPAWQQRNYLASSQSAVVNWLLSLPVFTDEQKAALGAELAKQKQTLQFVEATRQRSDELELAVADGKTVNWSAGTIEGAGSWPSEPSA